jgi:hypothetical protein
VTEPNHTRSEPSATPHEGASATFDPVEIQARLESIIRSPEFHASWRSQQFLKYVVEKTLLHDQDALKERTIGIEVFGRPSDYEPSTDATVRVRAGEVRKRLAAYYAGSGSTDAIHIELPVGGYTPAFVAPPPRGIASARRTAARWLHSRRVWAQVAGVAGLVLALWAGTLLAARIWTPKDAALRSFWGPVLGSDTPVVLCASYVPVYRLNDDHGAGITRPPRLDDFLPVNRHFIGGGDAVAIARLTKTFERLGQRSTIGLGDQVTFRDFKAAPTVLIGYSYTRWKQLGEGVRFELSMTMDHFGVLDQGKPTAWRILNVPADRMTTEDYAVVTRLLHPDTGRMVIVAAGLTQYGTEVAGDVISDETLLRAALAGAPSGWQRKNLELVLHTKIIGGEASKPRLLAAHFW